MRMKSSRVQYAKTLELKNDSRGLEQIFQGCYSAPSLADSFFWCLLHSLTFSVTLHASEPAWGEECCSVNGGNLSPVCVLMKVMLYCFNKSRNARLTSGRFSCQTVDLQCPESGGRCWVCIWFLAWMLCVIWITLTFLSPRCFQGFLVFSERVFQQLGVIFGPVQQLGIRPQLIIDSPSMPRALRSKTEAPSSASDELIETFLTSSRHFSNALTLKACHFNLKHDACLFTWMLNVVLMCACIPKSKKHNSSWLSRMK